MNNFKFILALGMTLCTTSVAFAGIIGPPHGGAPIDGGVSLLVGGIAVYGAKKIRDRRRRISEENIQKDI